MNWRPDDLRDMREIRTRKGERRRIRHYMSIPGVASGWSIGRDYTGMDAFTACRLLNDWEAEPDVQQPA